jgi:hypothetical protein
MGIQDHHFCAASLQVSNIMVGHSAVEGEPLRKFSFHILKLLST